MNLTTILSIIAFGATFTPALAVCCTECTDLFEKCVADCVAEGSTELACEKGECYGGSVSAIPGDWGLWYESTDATLQLGCLYNCDVC